jgi:hypothetical protein
MASKSPVFRIKLGVRMAMGCEGEGTIIFKYTIVAPVCLKIVLKYLLGRLKYYKKLSSNEPVLPPMFVRVFPE